MRENADKPRVLTFIGWYLPGHKSGGPVKTVSNLVNSLGEDFCFYVVTRDRDIGDSSPYEGVVAGDWNAAEKSSVFYVSPGVRGWIQIARLILKNRWDCVYFNSFFSIIFSFSPLILSVLKKNAVLLGPRGQFSEGAFDIGVRKKRFFVSIFKFLGLHRRVVWQASTDYERADINRIFGDAVDVFVSEDIGSRNYVDSVSGKSENGLRLVFLSRISPKKNLDFAISILKEVDFSVSLDIYGPKEDMEYWGVCESAMTGLPENVSVSYKGMVEASEVVGVLKGYDAFFFPTKGENYGHVIAEALCAGLPLLIADTTPWRNLGGIGWDFPLSDVDGFRNALKELNAMDSDEYKRLRLRVLDWAKKKFNSPEAVDANKEMLGYVVSKRPKIVG